ncbi:flippase [Pseudomonas helleri]|uniref:flippase n=1 Tax=Pseudomonas helleri TaxID=1608996 RepID=UPI003FD34ECC
MLQTPPPVWLNLLPQSLRKKIEHKKHLIPIISNSFWLILDKTARLAIGLFIGVWIARYLGPEQYGGLVYILAYLAIFQVITTLGMDNLIVRNIARDKEEAGKVLGTAFTLRVLSGFLCWIIAIGIMAVLNGWNNQTVWITALAGFTLIFQAADTIDLWFQSQSQSRRTVIAKLSAYIFSNGVRVALITLEAPLIAFAAAIALEAIAIAIGLIFAYKKFPTNNYWSFVSQQGKNLVVESWPFIISGLSIVAYMRIDQLMIKEILGEKELGIYAAVLPFATMWQFIPMTLSASLAPLVARRKSESEQAYMALLIKIFRTYAIIGWIVCIPTIILSSLLINSLLGAEYSSGSTALSIYTLTNVFINLGLAQTLWLINEGKSKLSMYKTIIGAIICITGNLLLIPKVGITGVAITAVAAQFGSAVLANLILAPEIFRIQINSLLFLPIKIKADE